jgi:hypothetical protein
VASVDERRADLRRALGWALVGGLTIAAVTASFALVTGSLEEEEWRVIGTSLGFAVFSALGAAGASLRLRGGGALGGVTVVLADRIERLADGDAQLRAECERLRSLARSAGG